MRKAEIDALVRAHHGRARPVALFHVLRQATLDLDDKAFLSEHVSELGASDLLRWKARCEAGFTGDVIRHLAALAISDPAYFAHDVLDVPRLVLADEEWTELADLLRGKVPPALYARVAERRCAAPPAFAAQPLLARAGAGGSLAFDWTDALGPRAGGAAPTLSEILAAYRDGAAAVDGAALAALAVERARAAAGEDWSFAVLDFPAALGDAILEKARRTGNHAERANLLGWLEAHGVPRSVLLDVALGAIRGGDVSYGLVMWLTRQLPTRAAWDKHGLAVLGALLGQRAFSEIGEIVTIVWSNAGGAGDAPHRDDPPRALLEAMQTALALALLGLCRDALSRGDDAGAMAALSALACLDPPSRVSRAVHDLRRVQGLRAGVAALVAVNERLVKHSDARDASLEGLIAAVHAIADSLG